MSTSITEITTPYVDFGNAAGDPWSSKFTPVNREKLHLKRLSIGWDGSHITMLMCTYNENTNEVGFKQRTQTENWNVDLSETEWITKFEAASDALNVPNWIRVTTNLKTYGPYGVKTNPTNMKTLAPEKEGYGALFLEGKTIDRWITSLQVIWTKRDKSVLDISKPPSSLKFYSGHPGPFNANLTPMVTLAVGNPPQRFTIHEGLVGTLPFFTNGSDSKPQPRDILMPSDDPKLIVAFLEYLSTGSYTYEHGYPRPASGAVDEIPPVDLAQGKFHLSLYGTAIKYECFKVSKAALDAAIYVLDNLTTKPEDTLEFLKYAYTPSSGVTVQQLTPETSISGSKGPGSLKNRIQSLGGSNKQLLRKVAKESPALAVDLLELLTS